MGSYICVKEYISFKCVLCELGWRCLDMGDSEWGKVSVWVGLLVECPRIVGIAGVGESADQLLLVLLSRGGGPLVCVSGCGWGGGCSCV